LVARIWRGAVRREDGDSYGKYLVERAEKCAHYEVSATLGS